MSFPTATPLGRPHHDGSGLHLPDGEGALGERVRVRVRVPDARVGIRRLHVRSVRDGEPHFGELIRVDGEWWEGAVEQRNPVTSYRFLLDGGRDRYAWLTQEGIVDHDVTDDSDFRLVAREPPPAWAQDAVLYQVFPDRFADSGRERVWPDHVERADWEDPVATERPRSMHQYYGGDLWGAADRMGHLLELGVTGVYLNPVFPAPENHRYCASSFDEVDPLLGGDEALIELSRVLHDHGIRLIGDLTANHSGVDHPWFVTAREDRDAPEAGFYHWLEHPDHYEAWLGVPTLPKLDLRDPLLRQRLFEGPDSVVARWLAEPYGLDGWRVDAANMAGRSGEVDVTRDVARTMRDTMAGIRSDAYLLAEHCHDASADLQGDGWHGTMNYTGFTRPVWQWLVREDVDIAFLGVPVPVPRLPGSCVAAVVDRFASRIPWRSRVSSLNLLGSHDTARWRYVAGDRSVAHVGIAMLLTFPGVPSILYGDEIGMDGQDDARARAPMPWHRREEWDRETFRVYRDLIALRRSSEALRRGGFRWVHIGDDVLVWLRETADERILVQVARAEHEAVRIDASMLGAATAGGLLGSGDLAPGAEATFALPAGGPAWHVWRLN